MTNPSNETLTVVHSRNVNLDSEYVQWMHEIKQRFRNAQIKAAVKVNSEQLLFNWRLGRDLVIRRAEEKWGKGIVEQVSLDLQAEFPNVKGFSTSNLWYMKKWYQFYSASLGKEKIQQLVGEITQANFSRLQQIGTPLQEETLQQSVGEISFPFFFSYVPWGHHILIITKCKSVEEALFYIQRTIDKGLSRSALDNCIRADMYHAIGSAVTNFGV